MISNVNGVGTLGIFSDPFAPNTPPGAEIMNFKPAKPGGPQPDEVVPLRLAPISGSGSGISVTFTSSN
jgi:hypothetical protein